MGFLLTLLLSMVFGVLGAVRPRIAFFIILALFAFFDELGTGFTTFRGSFVFNPYFVGFYGLRLIEVLIASTYIPFLLFTLNPAEVPPRFRTERAMALVFLALITSLSFVEFSLTGKFEWRGFRLVLTGMMLFHMLVVLFKSEDDIAKLCWVFLVMLSLRAAFGLAMWAAGYGQMTFRGVLPFFWDSKQVEIYGLGVVILTGYLLNYRDIQEKFRIIPVFWSTVMFITMLAAVAGSIRRTVWFTTILSMLIVMVISRRTTALHYFAIVFLAAVSLGTVLLAPGLDDFRKHMGGYVQSMNLFSEDQRESNAANAVHINNVEQYSKMLIENPDILVFGIHGPSGTKFKELVAEYGDEGGPLGQAHNGLIRSLLFFGFVGLMLYLAMIFVAIARTWRVFWWASEHHAMKHVALACGVYLVINFAASLFFVPPFYTTSKGLLYTFFQMFILGSVAHLLARTRSNSKLESTLFPVKQAVPSASQ